MDGTTDGLIESLEAEIERLRGENSRLILTEIERDWLRDEIERLRSVLNEVKSWFHENDEVRGYGPIEDRIDAALMSS